MNLFEDLHNRERELMKNDKHLMSDAEFLSEGDSSVVTSFADLWKISDKKVLLESNISWVYACTDAISNEIANIDFHLYKVGRNGETIDEIKQHPILDLLSRANQYTTKFDLFYLTQTYLELTGEAPWLLRKETKGGEPTEIYLLRPDLLTVKGSDDPTKKLIGGYTYKVYEENGAYQEVHLEPEEVIFLKYPDPTRQLRGRGTLQAVLRAFQMDSTAEEFNLTFFQNGATPSSLLSVPKPLTKDSRAKLEKQIAQKFTRLPNAHKTIVVEGDMKFSPLNTSQREMDYIATMVQMRDKILAIFRVPRTALGITDDVNRANAEATDVVFAKRTIKPKMEKVTQMLNEFLVPMFDDTGMLFLDYDDPVPENLDQKLTLAKEGANAGLLTPNEAREILGYDPVEGGDDLKVPQPFGFPPADGGDNPDDTADEPTKRYKTVTVASKKKLNISVERVRAVRKRTDYKRKGKAALKEATEVLGEAFGKIIEKQMRDARTTKKVKMNPLFVGDEKSVIDQKYEFQNKQLIVVDEYEAYMMRSMNSIFKRQKKMILDKIKEAGKLDADAIRLPEIAEAKYTHEQLTPILNNVIKAQSREAFALLGKAFKEFEEKRFIDGTLGVVSRFLKKRVYEMAKKITQETNDQLGITLAQAVENGDSIPKASKAVAQLFDNFGYRSERIARTEIVRASNFATEESFKESGVVEGKEWLATLDERTGETDAALDGQVVKLGADFHAGGESVAYPPLHPNCRCTLIPVIVA